MANLKVTRKKNEREPIAIEVTFPVTTDLAGVPVKFYMSTKDWATKKIDGATATATDITPSGAGVTPKTKWRLRYEPDADDFNTAGAKYLAEFEVDFGADQKRYYPVGRDYIEIAVRAHPAAS